MTVCGAVGLVPPPRTPAKSISCLTIHTVAGEAQAGSLEHRGFAEQREHALVSYQVVEAWADHSKYTRLVAVYQWRLNAKWSSSDAFVLFVGVALACRWRSTRDTVPASALL